MPSKFRGIQSKAKKKPELAPSEVPVSETELNELLSQLNEPIVTEVEKPTSASYEDTEKQPELELKPTPKVFHKAYNTYWNETLRKYMLVTLEYDVASGYSKLVSVEPFADSQPTAIYKLQQMYTLKILKREDK